ncbi:hypothetical protein T265_02931 [Opisthorchis viverrini]|uniref:Uncharacterized protein n=1 Tax=Opisthorchis viverrini TaxID=6198 RepID=A0A074ZTE8_OPIVI|nr:hypothetical protein T265_02931 [Opisthorchis viverrini]KER30693.1 hypothetical protein T265_02931 [Opisthorchis viverrini]
MFGSMKLFFACSCFADDRSIPGDLFSEMKCLVTEVFGCDKMSNRDDILTSDNSVWSTVVRTRLSKAGKLTSEEGSLCVQVGAVAIADQLTIWLTTGKLNVSIVGPHRACGIVPGQRIALKYATNLPRNMGD